MKGTYLIFLSAAGFFLTLPPASDASAGGDSTLEDRVDRFLATLPDEFNGTILLGIGDSILMNKGYGWANRSFNIPSGPETKYEIASVTKDLTTVLALILVEKGFLELDATIDTYLPDAPPEKAGRITIRHLLLHRSGIPHHVTGIPDFIGFHDRIYHTPRELLDFIWEADLVHEPGAGSTYSSPGYWLLTYIMETATGRSFPELLEEHILRPLGMANTFVDNDLTVRANLAVGYKKGIGGFVEDVREEQSNNLGAGDIISTTEDLYRFQRILSADSGPLLSQPIRELLFEEEYRINRSYVRTLVATIAETPFNDGKDTLRTFGIGTGGNYGFQARLTRFIDQDACFVVLTNTHNDRVMTEHFFSFLQDLLFAELGIPLVTHGTATRGSPSNDPSSPPPSRLEAYAGIYRGDDNHITHVFAEDGILLLRSYESDYHGRQEVRGGPLIPSEEDTFFDANGWVPRFVRFVRPSELDPDGPLASLRESFRNRPDTSVYHLVTQSFGRSIVMYRWAGDAARVGPLSDYEGRYFSTEMQETLVLNRVGNGLNGGGYLSGGWPAFVPLKPDLFLSQKGFLVFHRYQDGSVRDFFLMAEDLDHTYGSLFIRKE